MLLTLVTFHYILLKLGLKQANVKITVNPLVNHPI